jgi:RND superfamily putative drug exporter
VSNSKEVGRHVTRIDIVLSIDPYTRASMRHLSRLETTIRQAVPAGHHADTELRLVGATASFRDLELVANRDRTRINLLVTGSVLAVLILLLRRVSVPIYLILSVIFGYLVTLGAAYAVFWAVDRHGFPGLDWTVPIFLFTLLIAIGEDYNIILVARVDEEQERHGPIGGVTEALARTGGTISGCGLIMAGTFSSLLFGGSLARMYQLGFALTFGVILDTFVIRPILVPAYLDLIHSGRWGAVGRLLGGKGEISEPAISAPGVGRSTAGSEQRTRRSDGLL